MKAAKEDRCGYVTAHGRRCRGLAAGDGKYCVAHGKAGGPKGPHLHLETPEEALQAELTEAAGNLDSPEAVSRVLGKIFMALLQDRLSLRKAGTLGFLGQMLLRSQREIAFHRKAHHALQEHSGAGEQHRKFLEEQDARKKRIAEHYAAERRAAEEAEQAKRSAAKRKECGSTACPEPLSAPASQDGATGLAEKTVETPQADSDAKDGGVGAPGNIGVAQETRATNDGGRHFEDQCKRKAAPTTQIEKNRPEGRPLHKSESNRREDSRSKEKVATPAPPDLNHFYPRDPQMIAAGLQAPQNSAAPPPDAEELRWRELSRRFTPGRRNH